jgi:hypothetical protein
MMGVKWLMYLISPCKTLCLQLPVLCNFTPFEHDVVFIVLAAESTIPSIPPSQDIIDRDLDLEGFANEVVARGTISH